MASVSWDRDHPRSRGVYHDKQGRKILKAGSSPLARGLRDLGLLVAADRGIIPARAGFTRPYGHHAVGSQDHPRSRGVYQKPNDAGKYIQGSSPLARGLRVHRH